MSSERQLRPPGESGSPEPTLHVANAHPDVTDDAPLQRPVVLPSPEHRTKRRRAAWLLSGLALAAVPLVWLVSSAREPSPGGVGRGVASTDGPRGSLDSRVVAFNRAADELVSALTAYRTRQADFDLGRIDCAGLVPGYARVDAGVVALARHRASVSPLTREVATRFDGLIDAADVAGRRFDASGCPRTDDPSAGPGRD